MTYQELIYDSGEKVIVRIDENGSQSTIPMNESNSDFRSYLLWKDNKENESI